MGRVIRTQRRGHHGSALSHPNTTHRKGSAKLRKLDFAERNGYLKGVIEAIAHDPGRGAPLMKIKFRNPYRNQKDEEVIVAPEGVYSGQFVYFGKKAQLAVGNVLPIGEMPEGTIMCNLERYPSDRGKIAKCSGEYATVIGHNEDAGTTKVRMPSGSKKTLSSDCRSMVGLIAGVSVVRSETTECGARAAISVASFAVPSPPSAPFVLLPTLACRAAASKSPC